MSDIIQQEPRPVDYPNSDAVSEALIERYVQEDRNRTIVGAGMVAGAIATGCFTAWAYASNLKARFTHELPYLPAAQDVVNNVDDVLAVTGGIALPLAIAVVGAAKIGAHFNPRLRAYDMWSSKEMSDSAGKRPGFYRKVLRRVAAGHIPVVAATGVALGAFTAGISTEVTEGPSRIIDAMDKTLPGESMVVQYRKAMPMVESHVHPEVVASVRREASERGVSSHVFDLSLGTYTYKGQFRDNLALGIETPPESPIAWAPTRGCTEIPVLIDKASGIPVGEHIVMNGITATVAGEMKDISAMGRIGLVVNKDALHECVKQSPDAPSHAVVLDTDPEEAQAILDAANPNAAKPAAVITKAQYRKNSEEFWASNVQPITGVFAQAAGLVALISMAGIMGERLVRNRREWAAKLAAGLSASQLRTTELLRSAKDGVIASLVGTGIAFGVTPASNMLESGFRAGIGAREAFVGFGLGVLGTVGGGLVRLMRLKRAINAADHTRI